MSELLKAVKIPEEHIKLKSLEGTIRDYLNSLIREGKIDRILHLAKSMYKITFVIGIYDEKKMCKYKDVILKDIVNFQVSHGYSQEDIESCEKCEILFCSSKEEISFYLKDTNKNI